MCKFNAESGTENKSKGNIELTERGKNAYQEELCLNCIEHKFAFSYKYIFSTKTKNNYSLLLLVIKGSEPGMDQT